MALRLDRMYVVVLVVMVIDKSWTCLARTDKEFYCGLTAYLKHYKPLLNSQNGWDPNYQTSYNHGKPDTPPLPVGQNACLNDLSYIPLNNEQNEPTQGDIGETSNEQTKLNVTSFKSYMQVTMRSCTRSARISPWGMSHQVTGQDTSQIFDSQPDTYSPDEIDAMLAERDQQAKAPWFPKQNRLVQWDGGGSGSGGGADDHEGGDGDVGGDDDEGH
nr:hypothetical protein [Tanacetum cinerariifolium]